MNVEPLHRCVIFDDDVDEALDTRHVIEFALGDQQVNVGIVDAIRQRVRRERVFEYRLYLLRTERVR